MCPRILSAAICAAVLSLLPLSAQARAVVDAKGRSVTVPERVERVAVGGALNQIVLMLGAGDRIVGTSGSIKQVPFLERVCPRLRTVPSVFGTTIPPVANIEAMLAVRPDVVFGDPAQLKGIGIPVVELDLSDAEGIKRSVMAVGRTLGGDALVRARKFVAQYDATVARVKKVAATLPVSKRPRVYSAGGRDGLVTDGKGSIADGWIETAGGINVAARGGIVGASKPVGLEQVLAWDPEAIVATTAQAREAILEDPRWAKVAAVRAGRVWASPKGVYVWAVRSGEGLLQYLWVATRLHPDAYKDIDIEAETRAFYGAYYGYSLRDAEIRAILEAKE